MTQAEAKEIRKDYQLWEFGSVFFFFFNSSIIRGEKEAKIEILFLNVQWQRRKQRWK